MAIATSPQPVCEFWIGRAGSGKTFGCLEAIAQEMIRSPRGRPLILLAPEQASVQLERRLAGWPGLLGGYSRARVFSFGRLARLALEAEGEGAGQAALGETARAIVLRRAIRRRRTELEALSGSAGLPGAAEAAGRTLTELERYGWTPERIEIWLGGLSETESREPLARKLRDLVRLWRDLMTDTVQGGWIDGLARHQAMLAAVRRWEALQGCRVWVDGFSSLTSQETDLLEALLEKSEGATVAICADPASTVLIGGTPPRRSGAERLFENAEKSCLDWMCRLRTLGWETPLVKLPRPGAPTRFAASPALEHLESRVLAKLRPRSFDEASGDGLAAAIQFIEASGRRQEVEAAARRIVSLCRSDQAGEPALSSWNAIGVLTRDLSLYEGLVHEIFAQFEIPCFIDRPRETAGHPLARLLLTALEVVRSDRAGRAVIHHLKCGLAPIDDLDAAARIENHILRVDPERRGWIDWLDREPELQTAWRQVQASLAALARDLRSGLNPARALWSYLEQTGAKTKIEAWIAAATEAGDAELAQLHERAWSGTIDWLEELESLHEHDLRLVEGIPREGDPATRQDLLEELTASVESALAVTRAKLIPPTLDQVTVGAVDRSRTPEIETLFVLGMNEGEFPKLWNSEAILGDAERERLAAGGRNLGPDSTARRLNEQYLAYIALTRPSRRLVLCRPMTGDDGKPANPSPVFAAVAEAFPQAPRRVIGEAGEGEDPSLGIRAAEWTERLSMAAGRWGTPERAGELAAMMEAGDPLAAPSLSPVERARGLAGRRAAYRGVAQARLDPRLAQAWLADLGALRATALERYGECPFQFFAAHFLRLEAREEAGLSTLDLGTIRHGILEMLFHTLRSAEGLDWGAADLATADRLIDDEIAAAAREGAHARQMRAGQMQLAVLAALGKDLKLAVRALKFAGERGAFLQIDAEWKFGGGELTLEVEGASLRISGTADRIDALRGPNAKHIRVIYDYKSGKRDFKLTRMLGGIDLQLPVYALARRGRFPEERIGGLFYWPLGSPLLAAAAGEEEAEATTASDFDPKNRPSGIFAEDIAEGLDGAVGPGEASPVFGFSRTKSGKLNATRQSHWPPDAFEALLATAGGLLQRTAEAIAAGRIEIRPFRMGAVKACDHCDFRTVCRRPVRDAATPFRLLDKQNRKNFCAALDASGGGDQP